MEKFTVVYNDELRNPHKRAVVDGLNRYAFQKAEMGRNNGAFSFAVLDASDEFLAGIQGYNYFGCCYIDLLCVDDDHRGKGYGRLLMQKVEELARQRDCLFLAANTMEFEARPFYEKLGFEVEFTRKGFEQGSSMYFMRKAL